MREFRIELEAGQRIDVFLAEKLEGKTRSAVQKLVAEGHVSINGTSASKNSKLHAGDVVTVEEPEPKSLNVEAEDIPLSIVYEDADLLVVNKPKGMVVHPAAGNETGTLVNALLYHCRDSLSGINGVIRPGIVHRIDKDTSGLLIVAKNDNAHVRLAEQIERHSFSRVYHAVVYGNVKENEGTIETQLGRHPNDRKKMAVLSSGGRRAVTHFRVLERYGSFTYLELRLETGRTHQIRVHMASMGHPVAGDPVYGPKKVLSFLDGQCLHAKTIGFVHPTTGEYLEFDSALPKVFENFLEKLRREAGLKPSISMEGILIASDLDGTLLRDDKTISETDIAAIRRFREAGGTFTVATGRSIPTVTPYLEALQLDVPIALYNGAMLYDPVSKEAIWETVLPEVSKKAVPYIYRIFGETVGIEVLDDHALYAPVYNDFIHWHLNSGGYQVPHERCGIEDIMSKRWLKVMFATEKDQVDALQRELENLNLQGIRIIHSAERLVEMVSADANKGSALKQLGSEIGIPLEKTAAIGDFYNDLEMIETAGFGIAVSNACREVQAAASLVVSSNEQNGVAEAIEYVMENNKKLF